MSSLTLHISKIDASKFIDLSPACFTDMTVTGCKTVSDMNTQKHNILTYLYRCLLTSKSNFRYTIGSLWHRTADKLILDCGKTTKHETKIFINDSMTVVMKDIDYIYQTDLSLPLFWPISRLNRESCGFARMFILRLSLAFCKFGVGPWPGTIQLTENVHLPQTGLCNGSKVLQGYPILELWGHCTTHILGF